MYIQLQVNEQICTRLAAYASKKDISWEAAIDDLLTKCEQENLSRSVEPRAVSEDEPIELVFHPHSKREFKRLLMQQKQAFVRRWYENGSHSDRIWNASNFAVHSDLVGNLRTGYAKRTRCVKAGVVKVEVSIEPFAN